MITKTLVIAATCTLLSSVALAGVISPTSFPANGKDGDQVTITSTTAIEQANASCATSTPSSSVVPGGQDGAYAQQSLNNASCASTLASMEHPNHYSKN